MKIIYRTCEELMPTNGQRPEWCMEKAFKLKCFKSLANAVIKEKVELYIIGDQLSEEGVLSLRKIYPELIMLNSTEKLGNRYSLLKVFELADTFDENEIVYFCEDDYLYRDNFYANTLNFFTTIGEEFENLFFHPTDYPDQYIHSRIRKNYIFKNSLDGWYREVDSATFTFACSVKTYKKFSELLKDCSIRKKVGYDRNKRPLFHPTGADDGRFSEIFGYRNPHGYTWFDQKALCFCPLPGIASHMHYGTESMHFNWQELYAAITL